MADVLEYKGNLPLTHFRPQQVIMIILQLGIREVIPSTNKQDQFPLTNQVQRKYIRAGISIKQSRRFDSLFPILTPLALESIVCLTDDVLFEQEQLPQLVAREMSLCVLFLVYDARG